MKRFGYCSVMLLILILGGQPCHAAKLKAYVNRFSVSIPENKEELKVSLQTLLMSRLNGEEIQAIENEADAEIQIAGSYIAFGTVFSLDAVVKTSAGVFIDRVFVQGDTQNDLIPSVAEMARRLRRAILQWKPTLMVKAAGGPLTLAADNVSIITPKKEFSPGLKTAPVTKPQKLPEQPWISPPLPEILNGIASGRTTTEGTELFVTGEHYLRYYLKGKSLQLLAELVFEPDEKILGVDVADLDKNGVPEVYVTMLKAGLSASQVYIPDNNLLKKVKDNLPYILRGIALEGKEKKIFAQKLEGNGNFSGDVYELVKSGAEFIAGNPLQLPLFGNLYNFNRFSDSKGRRFFIVAHPDGYLLVYSKEKKQLWKSRDKFGGSELFVCQSQGTDPAVMNSACNVSLPQRLLVTGNGDVIVSRNTGMSTSGVNRSYSRNNVVQFVWNGVSLVEKWRSAPSQNYLADFSYGNQLGELLLLEVEPKSDSGGERGSRIVVKRLE